MKLRNWCAAIAVLAGAGTTAIAQSDFNPSPNIKQYIPRLVAIMSAAQNQHLKLWFAGRAKNWELAAYQLRQLTDSLAEAAVLYPGIPVSNITTMKEPLLSVADAVLAGDGRGFTASMRKLTDGCNGCHASMDRGYVVMALPTDQQPPANQVFAPPATDRKK
jgi:hypothetical protein